MTFKEGHVTLENYFVKCSSKSGNLSNDPKIVLKGQIPRRQKNGSSRAMGTEQVVVWCHFFPKGQK